MEDVLHWLQLDTFVPSDLLIVLVLIILEGLLSCDNAVVLALLVKDLPPKQRRLALHYGILGAYVFRISALCLATWIMSKWYLKVAGGAYLVFLAWRHFSRRSDHQPSETVVRRVFGLNPFWSTVIAVEMTDIVFSVDSIAAAVALSDKLWVLIAGGLLGILAMRFAAQGFVTLLQRFPRLETAAFVAVAVIGFKLLIEFPVDVVGRTTSVPATATYHDAASYEEMVDRHVPPFLHINHVISINLTAAPEPDRDMMRRHALARLDQAPAGDAEKVFTEQLDIEFRRAKSQWNLHHRPFIEVEGWLSSLAVLGIFAAGFRRRRGPSSKTLHT